MSGPSDLDVPMPTVPLTPARQTTVQVARFAGVGVLSTVVHLGLFAALRGGGVPAQVANVVALVVATVGNTALNRCWTFGVRGRERALAHHAQGLAVFAVTTAATSAALALLSRVDPSASAREQLVVVAAATAVSTAARFVVMRRWAVRPGRPPG